MSVLPVVTSKNKKTISLEEQFTLTPSLTGSNNKFLDYQKEAWKVFQSISFPTEKDEAWRRTSLRGLQMDVFKQPNGDAKAGANVPEELIQPLAGELHGGEILLTDANAVIQLNEELSAKGVIFTDLKHAQTEAPQILEKVISASKTYQEDKFASMAAAFAQNGVLLYVPRNVVVDNPLHSLIWASGDKMLNAHQVFVYLEENSSATYVHESSSPHDADGQNLNAALIEVHVGPGAKLNFVELQSLGVNEWNFTHEKVNVERDAEVDWIFGSLGSHLTKNFSDLNLVGEGSTGKMSGFYFTNGNQHLDHDTQQNHLAANTTSDLLFKGALLDESRSVWQGMIYVDESAVKTDGYQANRNLVLSEKARADSIPGLEIKTDDVRCTHGATVGKIDADQVFYLESRGIPRKEAEKLIVEGFFDPIMQRIPFEGVRNRFQNAIEQKMKEY